MYPTHTISRTSTYRSRGIKYVLLLYLILPFNSRTPHAQFLDTGFPSPRDVREIVSRVCIEGVPEGRKEWKDSEVEVEEVSGWDLPESESSDHVPGKKWRGGVKGPLNRDPFGKAP